MTDTSYHIAIWIGIGSESVKFLALYLVSKVLEKVVSKVLEKWYIGPPLITKEKQHINNTTLVSSPCTPRMRLQ